MKLLITLYVFYFFSLNKVVCQNLVPNGSFEETFRCPNSITLLNTKVPLKNWYSPSFGTPDLFHLCSKGSNSIPKNFMGESYPYNGNAYVGLCLYKLPEKTYREYLAVKLLQPLRRGIEYELKFYYKLSSFSRTQIDSIQVVLTPDSVFLQSYGIIDKSKFFHNALMMKTETKFDRENWKCSHLDFTAKGNERYLYIGNFDQTDISQSEYDQILKQMTPSSDMVDIVAYYYFDAIELIEKGKEIQEFSKGVKFQLEKVYFDFDSFFVKPDAQGELNLLAQFMIENPELKLTINGYADNVGNRQHNIRLSLLRSKAIKDCLVKLGVEEERIQVEGYGSSNNVSIENSLNRRAEFLLN